MLQSVMFTALLHWLEAIECLNVATNLLVIGYIDYYGRKTRGHSLLYVVMDYRNFINYNTKPCHSILEVVVNKERSNVWAERCSCKHDCKWKPTNEKC